jgi:hypothetical protein
MNVSLAAELTPQLDAYILDIFWRLNDQYFGFDPAKLLKCLDKGCSARRFEIIIPKFYE